MGELTSRWVLAVMGRTQPELRCGRWEKVANPGWWLISLFGLDSKSTCHVGSSYELPKLFIPNPIYSSGGSPNDEGRKSTNVDFAQRSGRAQNLCRCITEGAARERSASTRARTARVLHRLEHEKPSAQTEIQAAKADLYRTMHVMTRKMQSAGSSRRRSSIDAELDARVRCTLVGGRGRRCMQHEQGAGAAGVVRRQGSSENGRERAVGESVGNHGEC
ncbi:hypothetical protein C8F04DRAFT_1190969 [Mycena alexandri]|uniref:Uncharacterized protein n=1 Tax=Mycena alexandri TaxID=1745969 RepID=A0AAD6SE11_9AGAR|nr:hypothetical protein C8F04DRAFT_1190969 [Mycena alexandri]